MNSVTKRAKVTATGARKVYYTVPQMIPIPQLIPKMDHRWSSTAKDPHDRPQMIGSVYHYDKWHVLCTQKDVDESSNDSLCFCFCFFLLRLIRRCTEVFVYLQINAALFWLGAAFIDNFPFICGFYSRAAFNQEYRYIMLIDHLKVGMPKELLYTSGNGGRICPLPPGNDSSSKGYSHHPFDKTYHSRCSWKCYRYVYNAS